MEQHVRILAWLHIIYGAVFDAIALLILAILMGAGAISGDKQAFFITSGVGILIAVVLLILSIPGILAGIGLLKFQQWGRILAIIVAVLHVLSFPFGTALAIYTFWVLLNAQTTPLFEGPQSRAA